MKGEKGAGPEGKERVFRRAAHRLVEKGRVLWQSARRLVPKTAAPALESTTEMPVTPKTFAAYLTSKRQDELRQARLRAAAELGPIPPVIPSAATIIKDFKIPGVKPVVATHRRNRRFASRPWDAIPQLKITDGVIEPTHLYSVVVNYMLTTGIKPSMRDMRRELLEGHHYPLDVVRKTLRRYDWNVFVNNAAERAGEIVEPHRLPWPPRPKRTSEIVLPFIPNEVFIGQKRKKGPADSVREGRVKPQSEPRYRSDTVTGSGHLIGSRYIRRK